MRSFSISSTFLEATCIPRFFKSRESVFSCLPTRVLRREHDFVEHIVSEMFEGLAEKLEGAFKALTGSALTKDNIAPAIKEIRVALLDADVSLDIVKEFVAEVEEKALGTDIVAGVTAQQMFVKVVSDELTKVMGSEVSPLNKAESGPTIILMAGLQGVGKTTQAAKLAAYLAKEGAKPFLIAADIYRPAAIDQLVLLAERIKVPVFQLGTDADPVDIARKGIEKALEEGCDTIIIDTAGRLTIDEEMMKELSSVKQAVQPTETLLVVDAMTGQEAATLCRAFDGQVGITGSILTKLDGDTRGGAALSIRKISGKPIKFVGVGEGMEDLQPFYPERMASRILGMGDVLSLVERATEAAENDNMEDLVKKIMDGTYDFKDFLRQRRFISKMGPLYNVMKMIPGMNKLSSKQIYEGEQKLVRYEQIIAAMNEDELKDPRLFFIGGVETMRRKRRVAQDSGIPEAEVNVMLQEFQQMRVSMRGMMQGLSKGKIPDLNAMASAKNQSEQAVMSAGKSKAKPKKKGKGFS